MSPGSSERTRQLLRPEADVRRAGPQVLVYAALSLVAIGAAEVRGQSPLVLASSDTWLVLPHPLVGHALGIGLGVVLALATISATRLFVKRWAWARVLHANLRPAVRGASNTTIVVLGLASAIGEELFFRGLLATTFGLIASSLTFGLLHQMRGNIRWAWVAWATVMGLLFGAIFFATGSLLGAIVAHAIINVTNLRFLRDTNVPRGILPRRRKKCAREEYERSMKHAWVLVGSMVIGATAVACSSLKNSDGSTSGGLGGDEGGASSTSSGSSGASSSGDGGGSSSGDGGSEGGPLSGGNGDPRYFQGPIPADSPALETFTITNGADGALVYDKSMGVMWQDNVPNATQELSLAQDYCTNLTYDGLTGWRLPTRIEALAVMDIKTTYSDSSVTVTALSAVSNGSCFWTASVSAVGSPPDHFIANSAGVSPSYNDKCATRCVRGLPIPATAIPVDYDLSDPTVIHDVVTGLYWERTPPSNDDNSLSTAEEKARCAKLTYAGKVARLPNVKELASITDETKYNPAMVGAFGIYNGAFITANPVWSVGVSDGRVNQGTTDGFDYPARCVAGP